MVWLGWVQMVLCVGLYVQTCAQSFNQRYDAWGRADLGWSVEGLPDGNYVVFSNSSYQDSLLYSSVVTSILISADGAYLDTSRLTLPERASYVGWANASGMAGIGGGIVGGGTAAVGDTNRAALYWYDESGSIIDHRELPLPGRSWIGRQAKQTPDGGYLLCGETSTTGFVDAFVLKTDELGIIEWLDTYGDVYIDVASSVDIGVHTNGYFMGGQQIVSNSNKQLWVQALNDTGAVVWSKVWGGSFDEGLAHISVLSDGNILVTSGWGTSPNNYAKYLAKLDHTDGSIIWEQTYGGQCEGCPLFVGLEIAPGGDLIAVGHTLIPGSSYFGTLLRTTNSGDSLWVRNYQYYDDMVSNGRGLLRDVQPTPDGGFIAVGVALSVAGHYGQDVWVVKTDSMGCIEPGCNLITGMATQLTNLKDALRLWPNPAHAGALVQVEIALPEGFKPDGPLRVTVVSSSGQLVAEEALRGTTGQLPTNNYAPGLYHLHLHDSSRWIAGAKLVVE